MYCLIEYKDLAQGYFSSKILVYWLIFIFDRIRKAGSIPLQIEGVAFFERKRPG